MIVVGAVLVVIAVIIVTSCFLKRYSYLLYTSMSIGYSMSFTHQHHHHHKGRQNLEGGGGILQR